MIVKVGVDWVNLNEASGLGSIAQISNQSERFPAYVYQGPEAPEEDVAGELFSVSGTFTCTAEITSPGTLWARSTGGIINISVQGVV